MRRLLSGIGIVCALIATGCGRDRGIVVASKNFTEQFILGELAAQQIERKLHLPVTRKLDLGGTLLAHEAMLHGDIDIYPEYTGTGASVVLKQNVPRDPAKAYIVVKDAYFTRFHLVWLPPLGFNNTFAMVVRREDGRRLKSATLSAAAEHTWRLGIGYEFLTRADGLASLDSAYHLKWQGTPKSMDLGLLYRALDEKRVDMAAGNSTDAQLSRNDVLVLADDRNAFPPYYASFVVREELLRTRPEVRAALSMLSNRVSDDTMRTLNRRVEAEHQPVAKVVHEFLAGQP